ncbi:MAG TPA: hypothetical protein VKP65_11245, partial [Rhodothermales bacterium]|nr:hypothetical protein [Rhodothermales bacterium]
MKAADEQMAAARWQQVRDLFLNALERPPEAWDAFLVSACTDDEALGDEVASLLAAHLEAEGGSLDVLDAEQASML